MATQQVLEPVAAVTSMFQFHNDIAAAARVTDWLPEGLPPVLPAGVDADLVRLALAGHSRGGHTTFALAVGARRQNHHPQVLRAHRARPRRRHRPVLPAPAGDPTNPPPCPSPSPPRRWSSAPGWAATGRTRCSLSLPAPPGSSSRRARYHVVAGDFVHLDMLDDDDAPRLETCLCKEGDGCKGVMRRTVAGIMWSPS
ncbi:hypothetical protein SETIT_2G134500v2 [Setaria italica]|uniref:Chlorophyllase n=1 Tax=Setaria italica TaxID=4555 RepID=K4A283_SETIT|nr:hypothetical protein SETIT_2G134500v2 [Setaria italica]